MHCILHFLDSTPESANFLRIFFKRCPDMSRQDLVRSNELEWNCVALQPGFNLICVPSRHSEYVLPPNSCEFRLTWTQNRSKLMMFWSKLCEFRLIWTQNHLKLSKTHDALVQTLPQNRVQTRFLNGTTVIVFVNVCRIDLGINA